MDLLSLLKSMEPMKKRQPAPSLADEPKKRKESTPQTHPKNSVSNAPQSKRQKTQDDTTAGNAPQSTDATKIIEQRKAFEAQQRLVAERLATRRQARGPFQMLEGRVKSGGSRTYTFIHVNFSHD
jgi:hypothetical protein